MTGTPDDVAAYDRAIDRLLRFDVEVLVSLGELMTEHAGAPMTHVFGAYLCLTSTDTATLDDARAFAGALDTLAHNEREAAHATAIQHWLAGQWHAAARALDDLLQRWPTDLLALAVGQQLDFAVGDPLNMRDRIGRSLGALGEGHPHHAFVLGMHAFGLEECGTYDAAEEAGMAALAGHPDDVWAVHAVAHVHEMRGDTERGIDFLTSRTTTGARATSSPSTCGGTWRCTSWSSAGPTRCSPSTTPACTTRPRRASRSRCSTPARCCGACTSTASTSAPASTCSPTPGRPGPRRTPGTCSTTSTPPWRWPAPAASPTPEPWSTAWPGRCRTGPAPRRTAP